MNRISLVMKLLKTDYPNYVNLFGFDQTEKHMSCLHGKTATKKEIYQWYNQDYVRPPLQTDLWGNKYRGWLDCKLLYLHKHHINGLVTYKII